MILWSHLSPSLTFLRCQVSLNCYVPTSTVGLCRSRDRTLLHLLSVRSSWHYRGTTCSSDMNSLLTRKWCFSCSICHLIIFDCERFCGRDQLLLLSDQRSPRCYFPCGWIIRLSIHAQNRIQSFGNSNHTTSSLLSMSPLRSSLYLLLLMSTERNFCLLLWGFPGLLAEIALLGQLLELSILGQLMFTFLGSFSQPSVTSYCWSSVLW